MADYSVTELLTLINHQIDFCETLDECLSKAEALTFISLTEDFLSYPKFIIHSYLWTLNEMVERARELNEQSLDLLLRRDLSRVNLSPDV